MFYIVLIFYIAIQLILISIRHAKHSLVFELLRSLVLKWVQPKLNCALSWAFEHCSE